MTWKSLTMACVEEGVEAGMSASQIADTYGISKNTAHFYAWVARHPDRYKASRRTLSAGQRLRQVRRVIAVDVVRKGWSEEEIAKLAQWSAFGVSYGQMAKRLGAPRTRNSVAGKVHRLKQEGVIRG